MVCAVICAVEMCCGMCYDMCYDVCCYMSAPGAAAQRRTGAAELFAWGGEFPRELNDNLGAVPVASIRKNPVEVFFSVEGFFQSNFYIHLFKPS